MFHSLLTHFSMKATVKHCAILSLIVGLNINLISCGGDETPEDFIDSQTSLAASDIPIDVEEMVFVSAGEVRLGTDSKTLLTFGTEADTRTVFVAAFYIDKYEVTNKQYAEFLSETGHRKPKFWEDPRLNAPDQPVVGVNWEDAEAYAAWAGKRLPTASEWEKAARGTDGRLYPWGNDYDAARGNFDDGGSMDGSTDGYAMTPAPVGNFTSGISPYGLHDMAGNVWEWVVEWSETTDGQTYAIRGGSWTNGAGDTRTTVAYIYPAQCSDHSSSVGFRCVKNP
ncbi:hypothetical protein C6503_18160 [Candidatus Poribacteria bacterium]|nr:MAG: hypothetical protein C6503_18160 [Candidatus Poribacteria bacterium]